MKKRLLSLLIAVVSLFAIMAAPVSAQEQSASFSYDSSLLTSGPVVVYDKDIPTVYANADQEITPYLTYLTQASCNLTIKDGIVSFYGTVSMYRSKWTRIILTLQRSTNGYTWTDVPDMEWQEVFYTNGGHSIMKDISGLPGGYYYRVHNEASALDTNYAVLETVNLYSRMEYKS